MTNSAIINAILEDYSNENLLKELKLAIKNVETNADKKSFTHLLIRGMQVTRMSDEDFKFPCFRWMIKAWRTGKNIPQPSMRKTVYQQLFNKIEKISK